MSEAKDNIMNIYSTEEERYRELKDRTLTIIPWNEEKKDKLAMRNPDVSVSKHIRDCARNLGLYTVRLRMADINEEVKFNKNSVNESIAAMCRQQADLHDLMKLFTVLPEVASHAVQIDVEPYRHQNASKLKEVLCMHQYISGFCDEEMVYPVKLTVEERKIAENTYVHVVVTIGKIKKEALPIYGFEQSETPRPRATSFTISISDFIPYFNRSHGVLIKNIPDQMLSQDQKIWKQKVQDIDRQREQARISIQNKQQEIRNQIAKLKEEEYRLQYEPEDYGDDDYELD